MDIVCPIPRNQREKQYILVFTDHLTSYVELVTPNDKTATGVYNELIMNIICKGSCLTLLVCDNAYKFTFKIITDVCKY